MLKRTSTSCRCKRPTYGSFIEALETRTYFDLVPAVAGVLPAALIATLKTTAMVTVNVQNTGGASIKGPYTIQLLASPDGQLGDATPITLKDETLAPLAAGATRAVKVPIGTFPAVANGNYFILAEVGGTLSGAGDNLAVSSGQIAVANPFVDLTDSLAFSSVKPVKPGQTLTFSATLTNLGNITAKGHVEVQIGSTTDAGGANSVVRVTPATNINIAPGKHATFHFTLKVPAGFTPGTYFATATLNADLPLVDSNAGNNFAVTPTSVVILDPFPDITGTHQGAFKLTKGPNKGTNGTLSITINSESNTTGAVTGQGSNSLGQNFSIVGNITTTGAVTLNIDDVADNITGTLIGKLSKGKITGTVTQVGGNGGTFTLTL